MEEIVYLIILMHFIIVFILSKIKLIFKSYFTLNKMKKLTNNKVQKNENLLLNNKKTSKLLKNNKRG